jgi:hypothetical protein
LTHRDEWAGPILKFVLHAKFDEKLTLLDTLISLVTLMLFYTMIDFNSEEVMYRLVLVYLLPCRHLMRSQIATLGESTHEVSEALPFVRDRPG